MNISKNKIKAIMAGLCLYSFISGLMYAVGGWEAVIALASTLGAIGIIVGLMTYGINMWMKPDE